MVLSTIKKKHYNLVHVSLFDIVCHSDRRKKRRPHSKAPRATEVEEENCNKVQGQDNKAGDQASQDDIQVMNI